MIQSIKNNLIISSQQSVDGGRNAYGSNAPESTVCGLLRVNDMKKYFTKCLVCINPVESFPSRVRKFCSHKCSSKLRNELKEIKCEDCGIIFLQTSSHQERCGSPTDKQSCSYKHKRKIAKYTALFRRYNLTKIDYENLLKNQNNRCAICKEQVQLHIDHSHKTKKIRGLLCQKCNTALGLFKDNIFLLEKAKNYLAPFAL